MTDKSVSHGAGHEAAHEAGPATGVARADRGAAGPTGSDPTPSATHTRPRLITGMWPSGLVGGLAMASGVALTAASAWLIVAASFQPPILWLLAIIVSVRAFGIARPVLRYVERLMSHNTALRHLADTRTAVYRALIPLTPARLGRRGRGDVLAGVVDDLDDIAMAQIRVAVPFISLGVAGLIATLVNAVILYPAALVTLGTVAASALVGWLDYVVERRTQAAAVAARAEVGQLASTITGQASELASIGGGEAMLTRLAEAEARLTRALTRQAWGRALGAGLAPMVNVGGGIVMAYVVNPWVAQGLSTPLAALLILTPIALGEVVGAIPEAVGSLARAQAAQGRIDRLLDQEPAVAATDPAAVTPTAADRDETDPREGSGEEQPEGTTEASAYTRTRNADAMTGTAKATALPSTGLAMPAVLALGTDQVTASWSPGRQALPPTSVEIPPGTMLAVTGPNGSGKSTLLAVLARHLDPDGGVYRQNGENALDLPLDASRIGLAVVDDETHVLASNVRENLRFTRPEATDEQIGEALRAAGLADWFAELPNGLDTRLGAGGQGVSGGERTRLGIARALLSGRPVVLLDEPTAHLDHPTAAAVLGDLRGARETRTVVLVTHREEGIDEADARLRMG